MDKEKAKEKLGEAAAQAKVAMTEIKDNFKADEGVTGFRKVTSRFVNLWKSGTTGRVALIASSVIVLILLVSLFGGGGSGTSFASKSKRPVPKDTLVVKGLYMGMSGDDALESCKDLVASSKDLVAVDFRNGFEVEREVGLGEYRKNKKKTIRLIWTNTGNSSRLDTPVNRRTRLG